MPPVEGVRAQWQPSEAGRERSSDAERLQAALDRISAALVRRAERYSRLADAARSGPPPLDDATVDELRRRLDGIIGQVRTLLGDAAP